MLAMKCVSLFLLLGRAGVWAEEHDLSFVLYCGEVVLRRWIPDGSLASKKSRGVGRALSSALMVALCLKVAPQMWRTKINHA